jgi:hypothetical protein
VEQQEGAFHVVTSPQLAEQLVGVAARATETPLGRVDQGLLQDSNVQRHVDGPGVMVAPRHLCHAPLS